MSEQLRRDALLIIVGIGLLLSACARHVRPSAEAAASFEQQCFTFSSGSVVTGAQTKSFACPPHCKMGREVVGREAGSI
jgi:hypothetical protein